MLTGQLGDVMKESAQAALSFSAARVELGSMPPSGATTSTFPRPAGAIPKDGPSAGVTMAPSPRSPPAGAQCGDDRRDHAHWPRPPVGGIRRSARGSPRRPEAGLSSRATARYAGGCAEERVSEDQIEYVDTVRRVLDFLEPEEAAPAEEKTAAPGQAAPERPPPPDAGQSRHKSGVLHRPLAFEGSGLPACRLPPCLFRRISVRNTVIPQDRAPVMA